LNIAALPAACPGRLVLGDDAAPADVPHKFELLPRFDAGLPGFGVTPYDRDDALKTHRLSRPSYPRPGRFQRVKRGRRQIMVVYSERRRGRHGETLARMP